jgi:hypothetical protein
MAERRGGKREKLFLFIFQTKFSNSFPNEFLNSNSFHQNHSSHKRNAPACMQQRVSNFLLNFNFPKFIYFPIFLCSQNYLIKSCSSILKSKILGVTH